MQSNRNSFIEPQAVSDKTNSYKGKIKKYPPDVVAEFCVEPPHTVGVFMLNIILFLSVADVNVVAVVTYSFCPDPHVGDILILCISVKPAFDIPFKI